MLMFSLAAWSNLNPLGFGSIILLDRLLCSHSDERLDLTAAAMLPILIIIVLFLIFRLSADLDYTSRDLQLSVHKPRDIEASTSLF
jgi:hypothetical protein